MNDIRNMAFYEFIKDDGLVKSKFSPPPAGGDFVVSSVEQLRGGGNNMQKYGNLSPSPSPVKGEEIFDFLREHLICTRR